MSWNKINIGWASRVQKYMPPISMDWSQGDCYIWQGSSAQLGDKPLPPNQLEWYALHPPIILRYETRTNMEILFKIIEINFEYIPLNLISFSAFLKMPGTMLASLTVSLINCNLMSFRYGNIEKSFQNSIKKWHWWIHLKRKLHWFVLIPC